MTADSQWAVQQAIYTAIRNDATIQSLVSNPVRVYSMDVPQDSAFPYIVIGEGTPVEWDTKNTDGMELDIVIHTWSRYRGAKECVQIMGAIVDAIDRQSLSLTGHTLVQLRYETGIGPLQDPDGLTIHGVQRFNALTQA